LHGVPTSLVVLRRVKSVSLQLASRAPIRIATAD
jgi:hypothetical protein